MQLTRFTDYALRVLMYLSYKQAALATISEISGSHGISDNHLTKVVHHLAKQGYITTLRGKGGGIKLARPPEQMNLGAVVRSTEETLNVMECLDPEYHGDCRLARACKLKEALRGAQAAFFAHLDQYSIADLLMPQAEFSTITVTGLGQLPPKP